MNPVYTGAIASQKKDYRFKIGTIGEKKPQDWIVVEQRHEPLIDSKSFAIVQDKLKSRQRPRQDGETSLFAGLIKCGECGKSLTIRTTHAKHPQQIYACKTYGAFGKNHCSQHRVEYDTPLPPCPEQNPGVCQGCPDRWGSHCREADQHL